MIERALLLATHDPLRPEDLPEGLGGAATPVEDLYRDFDSLDEGLRAFERYYLRRALAEVDGDEEAAARRVGLTRAQLVERLGRT